jgi:uncharacterized protein YyaL (SSP411 family)
MNRLAAEPSLYLRQHANNPVDWYPWGPEALARAAAEDKPLLISIGYSSCHWCHVMAHESFENPAIAAVMNEHFVCIKVDREERPDVDALYMQATLLLARQGGWPMTVFATPDARPFFAGTYYPPVNRGSMPGFADLCAWMATVYRERGDDVETQAAEIVGHLRRIAARQSAQTGISAATREAAVAELVTHFDHSQGGFGGAPKFPPSTVLEFLLQVDGAPATVGAAREMATVTLRRMADGGIRDQIGGGFHRYAVDDIWLVPHFEKMLYDNALLARAYVLAARDTPDTRWREVAEQTLDYLVRELQLPGGGFAAACDADSAGGEGAFFVWTPAEIAALLPAGQATAVLRRFGVTEAGNFEGRTILHAALPLPLLAEELGTDPAPLLAQATATLYAARAARPAPARDEKLIAAWNGLAIAAFADAGVAFSRQDYLDVAARGAARVLEQLIVDGRLHRTYQDGAARHLGQLEDYADVIHGLLQLYAATFVPRWLAAARTLADAMITLFADPQGPGFFATGSDAPRLLVRGRDLEDQPTPSGNSQAASVLVRLAGLTGSSDYLERAEQAIALIGDEVARLPLAFGTALGVVDRLTRVRREIAIVGAPDDPATAALVQVARDHAGPGDVIACGAPGDTAAEHAVPLLSGRPLVDGAPAAYVCEHFSCQAPVTSPAALRAALVT